MIDYSYDNLLFNWIDDYTKGCEPTPIEDSSEYHSGAYNCNFCDETKCEHWLKFNEVEND